MSSTSLSCPSGNCLSPGSIELLAEGLVEEPALSMFLHHIEICSQCQDFLDSIIRKSGKNYFSPENFRIPKLQPSPPKPLFATDKHPESSLSKSQFSRILESSLGQQFQNPKLSLTQSQFWAFECFDAISRESVWAWCLRPEWGTLPDLTSSLSDRARQASLISHPSLVQIKNWYPSHSGPIVITAIPTGQSLLQNGNHAIFSSVKTADIALQLLAGLEALHEHGIVLGPISPEDLFVEANQSQPLGQTKAQWGNIVFRPGLGLPGFIVGSQTFQSPESSFGKPPDFRSDFFCLGSVIFCLLTGQKPWPDAPHQIQHPKPFDAPQLTPSWKNLLSQLWELSPEDRLTDHQALGKLLSKIPNDDA